MSQSTESVSQFIVGIYQHNDNESKWEYMEDGFAIIMDRSYGPVLIIRTKESVSELDNRYYLDTIISEDFKYEYKESEDDSGFTARFDNGGNKLGIKFDAASSQAFAEFKEQIKKKVETKYKTIFYESGHIQYSGQFTEDEGVTGDGTEFYDTSEQKVKYKGEFEDNMYDGAGTFYSYDGRLEINSNNISSGKPNGKLKLLIHRKDKNDIQKIFNFRSDLDIDINIGDNNFCEKVARFFFTDLDNLFFEAFSLEEKVDELNKKVELLLKLREYEKKELENANRGLIQKMFGLLWN